MGAVCGCSVSKKWDKNNNSSFVKMASSYQKYEKYATAMITKVAHEKSDAA